MSFFINNKMSYNSNITPSEIGFRNCQLGAIWAIKSHFTISSEPALVSMPTGSGKTALMMALSFELEAKSVLVVTPSRIICHQIAEKFSTLDDLRNMGVYKANTRKNPKVKEQIGYIDSKKKWGQLTKDFDVVISTPNSSSPNMKKVATPNPPYFDVVFIDEAHHTGASIYKAIIETFTDSRIILLTATPFRRDKKRIPGHLIYHYPISKAIEDGIYRVVNYKPIKSTIPGKSKDEVLAEYAISLFEDEIKINPDAKILIKTDSKLKADELKSNVYDKLEFNVGVIHSDKSDAHNNQIIDQCKLGKIDGIICVGMIGEGLDIPSLKIAVLHSTPHSLPATIQFIGRLSRISSQKGNSILISDPDFVEGEVKELYRYNDGWEKLIPDLIDKKIMQTTYISRIGSKKYVDFTISKADITPFYSVTIYKQLGNFKINKNFEKDLPSNIEYYILGFTENEPIVIISGVIEYPAWISEEAFAFCKYDLHIYYTKEQYVYEYTSSEYYSNKIKDVLFGNNSLEKANRETIINGLRDSNGHYMMVGLANITGSTNSNPKYKTYMGKDVENSLRNSDGRCFSAGHVLSKMDNTTRGISTQNSKIWTIERNYLDKFIHWCDHLHSLIHLDNTNIQIPRMGMLVKSEYIDSIPDEPISVIFDDTLLLNSELKLYYNLKETINPNIKIYIDSFSLVENKIKCKVYLDYKNIKINVTFSLNSSPHWTTKDTEPIQLYLDTEENKVKKLSLIDFFNEQPPLIILSSGKSIKNNILFTPKIENERFDQNLFNPFPICWDDTDVFNEADELAKTSKYKYNVQNKTLSIISEKMNADDFIIVDDSCGEVADIIWFENGTNLKRITFFHCKFRYRDNEDKENRTPNADKRNITELIDQGLRCGVWVKSAKLVSQLINRINNTKKSCVWNDNNRDSFIEFESQYNSNDWLFRVVLVQPGLCKKAVFNKGSLTNVEKLLVTLYDRTKNVDAELEVWANESTSN